MMNDFDSSEEYDDESMPDIENSDDKSIQSERQQTLEDMNTNGSTNHPQSVKGSKFNIFSSIDGKKLLAKFRPKRGR